MLELLRTTAWVVSCMIMLLHADHAVGIGIAAVYLVTALLVAVPVCVDKTCRAALLNNVWPKWHIVLEVTFDLFVILLLCLAGASITASIYAVYAGLWAALLAYPRTKL